MRWYERLNERFWVVPALFCVAAIVLALTTTVLDETVDLEGLGAEPWGFTGDPDGAWWFLATAAGSIITVAGTAFSITMAVLALSSSQFGPRLIRNFIRDLGNQIVLGTFLATFLYCLVVLRTVRGGEVDPFVPYLSVLVATVLAIASAGMLIYFFAHVSRSIQVNTVVASIGKDLDEAIVNMFPVEQPGPHLPSPELDAIFGLDFRPVASRRSGYIAAADYERLARIAKEASLRVRVPHHEGQFIVRGAAIAEVIHDDASLPTDAALGARIVEAFTISDDRVADNDIEYFIDQLVEIAARALSAAVNDPFTAMACIDRLGASLRLLVRRELPSPYHYDADGVLRVVSKRLTFRGALDAAFNLIRQYGSSNVPVALRLIETIAIIAEYTTEPLETEALLEHAGMAEHSARAYIREDADMAALEERYRWAIKALSLPDIESI
jgi:uncharacterized membrane protein